MSSTNTWEECARLTSCKRADLAFAVYQSLQKAARENPELDRNPYWRAHRARAFYLFMAEFEVV